MAETKANSERGKMKSREPHFIAMPMHDGEVTGLCREYY